MRLLLALSLVSLAACYSVPVPQAQGISSFVVSVKGVYVASDSGPRIPVPVVSECVKKYGSDAAVPGAMRGTADCRYLIVPKSVDIDFEGTALDPRGLAMLEVNSPVSFKVTPGDLAANYKYRWATMKSGTVKATVRVAHLYGEVRVWVQDAPPQPIYAFDGGAGGGEIPAIGLNGTEPHAYATSFSPALFFEDPTLAKIQIPDGFDNRSSPFEGQFLRIGQNPQSGKPLRQSCSSDQANDNQPAMMVVTGIDPNGFFVTDVTACHQPEVLKDATGKQIILTPEPNGFYPGSFGSMYVYNYSYPDGLNQGDLLWTLSGSIQDFSGTTQLTFPAWDIREKVRLLPETEWKKYLNLAKPADLNLRHCGLDDRPDGYITDTLCGHNKKSLKMESLESALVRLRNVRFPQVFTQCDRDGDGKVPFFCETPLDSGEWIWRECGPEGQTPPILLEETQCHIDCATGQNGFANTVCSERSTFTGFGQFIVELPPPGPAALGMDDSLPLRLQAVAIDRTSHRGTTGYPVGGQVNVLCSSPVRMKFGDATAVATATDAPLAANTLLEVTLAAGQSYLAVIADGDFAPTAKCTATQNMHTRINVLTRDAVPDLEPDCNPSNPDATKASECKAFRAATYDVVGHLRHIQPGRPRWLVLPRDAEDICCHPGKGLGCPRPLATCK